MPAESAAGIRDDEAASAHEREPRSFAVVALANALLDMSITVKDDYLIHKYGLPCDGQIEVTSQQHRALLTDAQQNYPVEYVAGGSAQNTVRLVCRLVNNRPSCVIGKIARDHVGVIVQRLLGQDGVATRYAYDDAAPSSGCCVAIVRQDGTRCLAADVGAAGGFTLDHLDRVRGSEAIDRCSILLVEGFFASHSPQASLAAIRRAHSRSPGIVRLLGLSASYVCSESHAVLRQLLPYANVVAGNEDEFRALSDRLGLAESQQPPGDVVGAKAIARLLAGFDYVSPVRCGGGGGGMRLSDFHRLEPGAEWDWSRLDERLVLMTRGSAGVVVASETEAWDYAADSAPRDEVRDTTGAGDAFLAGFLSCVIDRRPLDECVARGQRIARLVIAQTGCRLPSGAF